VPLSQQPARDATAPGETDDDVDAPPLDFPPRTPYGAPKRPAHLCGEQARLTSTAGAHGGTWLRPASANWPGGVRLAGQTGLGLDTATNQQHYCCGERQHAGEQQGAALHERQ
jgi:hypothetical protein